MAGFRVVWCSNDLPSEQPARVPCALAPSVVSDLSRFPSVRPAIQSYQTVLRSSTLGSGLAPLTVRTYWLLTDSQVPSQFGRFPGGLLQLRRQAPRRPAPAVTSASSAASPALLEEDKKAGFLGIANITWKKILPLGFMFFCILFNYTILRDTKVRVPAPPSSRIQIVVLDRACSARVAMLGAL